MRQIKPLLRQQLVNLFGLNVLRNTRDPKQKRRGRLLAICWALVLAMVLFYTGGLAWGLCVLGAGDAVAPYLFTLAMLLVFFLEVFTSGGILFCTKDYDLVSSLPLTPGVIALSRLLRLYAEAALLAFVVTLPGLAVWGFMTRPGLLPLLTALLAIPSVPLLPLSAAALLGIGVSAVSGRMKHKGLAQAAISILVVLAVLALTPAAARLEENVTEEMLLALSGTVLTLLEKLCPPAALLGVAVTEGSIGKYLLFLVLSLAAAAVAAWLAARLFHPVCRSLLRFSGSQNYTLGTLEGKSVLRALWLREFKGYFSSGVYISNTIIGPILATVMSGALLVTGADTITASLPLTLDIPALVPFLVAGSLSMMVPSSVSVSMEGKRWWILKSLPLDTKTILDAKILMSVSLLLPFCLISEILLILALKPDIGELVWLVLIPVLLAVFSCVFGVAVNLRLPLLDWENETVVVKQSAAAMLGGLGGLLAALIGAGLFIAVPVSRPAYCAALLIATGLLYRSICRKDLREL